MDFNQENSTADMLAEKWEPVLEHPSIPSIGDRYKEKVTAVLLENQERALKEQSLTEITNQMGGGGFAVSQAGSGSSNLQGYDPILISLVRRSMPNLMAYDVIGVQPMSAPTGLIFAMRARYDSQTGKEALYQEAFAKFSGAGATTGQGYNDEGGASDQVAFSSTGGIDPTASPTLAGFRAMLTGTAESLSNSSPLFKEMAFSIERVAVEAKTRALKAEYTTELAQDLKAVHGLDAESELANILSNEILAEINREVIRSIYTSAKSGAQNNDLGTAGVYDLNLDSDGRWSAERFRGLMFQLEREANVIAKQTRRGKGNFVICSSDVASALAMGGWLQLSPALNTSLDVDDTGNTFVGTLNGKMKVYVDPYSATDTISGSDVNFATVGYRGTNPYDAGMFYCPYVPLQMVRAVGENTFQPKIGFKTRYGMVANPFAKDTTSPTNPVIGNADNVYYRLFAITNLHGNTSGF
jgi:hypothetical protein